MFWGKKSKPKQTSSDLSSEVSNLKQLRSQLASMTTKQLKMVIDELFAEADDRQQQQLLEVLPQYLSAEQLEAILNLESSEQFESESFTAKTEKAASEKLFSVLKRTKLPIGSLMPNQPYWTSMESGMNQLKFEIRAMWVFDTDFILVKILGFPVDNNDKFFNLQDVLNIDFFRDKAVQIQTINLKTIPEPFAIQLISSNWVKAIQATPMLDTQVELLSVIHSFIFAPDSSPWLLEREISVGARKIAAFTKKMIDPTWKANESSLFPKPIAPANVMTDWCNHKRMLQRLETPLPFNWRLEQGHIVCEYQPTKKSYGNPWDFGFLKINADCLIRFDLDAHDKIVSMNLRVYPKVPSHFTPEKALSWYLNPSDRDKFEFEQLPLLFDQDGDVVLRMIHYFDVEPSEEFWELFFTRLFANIAWQCVSILER
jgi:hypothetical protein